MKVGLVKICLRGEWTVEMIKSRLIVPVAQWIEHTRPKGAMEVRFLSGTLFRWPKFPR